MLSGFRSFFRADKPNRSNIFWGGLVVCILLLDQISKFYILYGLKLPDLFTVPLLPFLSLTMVWNPGISMGLPVEVYIGDWGLIALTAGITGWLMDANAMARKATGGRFSISDEEISRYQTRNATATFLGPSAGHLQDLF